LYGLASVVACVRNTAIVDTFPFCTYPFCSHIMDDRLILCDRGGRSGLQRSESVYGHTKYIK